MSSDWIIIGAVIVLFAGVVLAFRSGAQDAPRRKKPAAKSSAKGAVGNS